MIAVDADGRVRAAVVRFDERAPAVGVNHRGDQQDLFNQTPYFERFDEEPGHDCCPSPRVIGKKKTDAGKG